MFSYLFTLLVRNRFCFLMSQQAVQRGDAEMGQKVNRVIRACVELGDHNPIVSIHDQGAGGNGNVLKEIVEPEGARIGIVAVAFSFYS